jgi:ferric-dicitrate binding protein FerR (iron transport regulator)
MIQELLYKYFQNEASEDEVLQVLDWIEKSEENKLAFIELKKIWLFTPTNAVEKNLFEWNQLKKQLPKQKNKISLKKLGYAASFVIAFAIFGYLFKTSNKPEIKNNNDVENLIVLEKSTGTKEYISEKTNKIIKDIAGNVIAKQDNKELIYYKNDAIKTAVYNTIKVPFSKTFKITLSDGTIVHLNAGTTFTYPEQFVASENLRKVMLKGEAYFEVSKDKTKPFIVEANEVSIEVLGTTFNVSNYQEDDFINCVLTEGSVRLSEKINPENSILLEPNTKATWQKEKKFFTKKPVKTSNYNAWTQGELIFDKEAFNGIAKKIERYYNIKIINNYPFLASQEFTGTIKIKETGIENILELFKLDTPFNFILENGIVVITKP